MYYSRAAAAEAVSVGQTMGPGNGKPKEKETLNELIFHFNSFRAE